MFGAASLKNTLAGIVQLLSEQNLRDRMIQQYRAIALEKYLLEQQTKACIELYHQALQN